MRRQCRLPGRASVGGTAALVVASVLLAGCIGGSDGGGSTASQEPSADTCALIRRLDDVAAALAKVNVADPDAFRAGVDAALVDLSETLDALVKVVPTDARSNVQTMSELVEQRKFDEALQYRFRLDDLAVTECDTAAE